MKEIEELRLGLETAYIDGNVASNLMYKPQFVSNNYKEGKKVLSSQQIGNGIQRLCRRGRERLHRKL